MSSRRLDISSLLCDDDEPPKQPSSSSAYRAHPSSSQNLPTYNSPHGRPSTPTTSMHASSSTPVVSSPSQPYINFDALVHVATVERRRLSSGSSEQYSPPTVSTSPTQSSRLPIADGHPHQRQASHSHPQPYPQQRSPTLHYQPPIHPPQRSQPQLVTYPVLHQAHRAQLAPQRSPTIAPQVHHPHRPWELDDRSRQPPLLHHSPRQEYSVQPPSSPAYPFQAGRNLEMEPLHSPQPIHSPIHYRRHSSPPLHPPPLSNYKVQHSPTSEPPYVIPPGEPIPVSPRRVDSAYDRRQFVPSETPIIDRDRISVAALSTVAPDIRQQETCSSTTRHSPPNTHTTRLFGGRTSEGSEMVANPYPSRVELGKHTPEPPRPAQGGSFQQTKPELWSIPHQPSSKTREAEWPAPQPPVEVVPSCHLHGLMHKEIISSSTYSDTMHETQIPRPYPETHKVLWQVQPSDHVDNISQPGRSQEERLRAAPREPPRKELKIEHIAPNLRSYDAETTLSPSSRAQAGEISHSPETPVSQMRASEPKQVEDDAHGWFLEQITSDAQAEHHPPPASQSPVQITPTTMPEAATALEEELESVHIPQDNESKPPTAGVDVTTNLDADKLSQTKVQDNVMDVDVDNELLSLVEDEPQSKSSKRTHSPAIPAPRSPMQPDSPSLPPTSSMLPPPLDPQDRPLNDLAPGKRKKETATKAASKAKTKPRAKAAIKPKSKPVELPPHPPKSVKSTPISASHKKSALGPPRSRSTSVKPPGPDPVDTTEEAEEKPQSESGVEDDKLYCLCKTKYDEDRFMIACDRCDEWYHTQCVQMPDLEADLVDQFICPLCIERNPHLSLKTTYKIRCLYGLKHPNPSSPDACHKPARGHFSKYCSDECGINYMKTQIDTWSKKGGKREKLWESVKNARRREGISTCMQDNGQNQDSLSKGASLVRAQQCRIERDVERLNGLLDKVVKLREDLKRNMEVLALRERLLDLASQRAEQVGLCGWDQRLCFGDEEWADFGTGVLESYEENKGSITKTDDDMQVDADAADEEGEWWCPGDAVCDRHNGWQTIRAKEMAKERERKEDALSKLTTQEREIRKRIEDIVDVQDGKGQPLVDPPHQANPKVARNKSKTNHEPARKGKKRKAHA